MTASLKPTIKAAMILFVTLGSGVGLCEAQIAVPCPSSPHLYDTGGMWCDGPLRPVPTFTPGQCGCTGNKFYEVQCWGGWGGGGPNNGCSVECVAIDGPACLAEVETPDNPPNVKPPNSAPPPSGPPPPQCLGKPVSLTTGAMFFTHTDATVGDLTLSRTYNSRRLTTGRYGPFGPGWNESVNLRLRVLSINTIEVRLSDGFAQYYFDSDADGTYEAILPKTGESHIEAVQGGAGGYRRVLRSGGLETYDATGKILSVTDLAGLATTYEYDSLGRRTSVARRGRSITLAYSDDSSRPAQLLGPGGVVLATYTYNAGNTLEFVRYPDGGGYRYGYDAAGKVEWVSDLEGGLIERHQYSGSSAITSELTDGREKLTFTFQTGKTAVTDATGSATVYEYQDVAHIPRVTKATGPCSSCGAGGGSGSRLWSYDARGNVIQYQNELGDVWKYTYSEDDDLLTDTNPLDQATTYTYYSDGRVHTRTGPDGSQTTYVHGPAGPLSVTEKVSSTETRMSSTTYTTQGQVETIVDPRSKTTRMTYTPAGDLETVTDPLNHVTRFGYDESGRRTTVQDALGHTTTTSYDVTGRVTSIIQHDGTHTDFGYDTRGRRASVTDPELRVTRYAYNTYGWLEKVMDPAGGTTHYDYDLMGRLTSLTDAMGRTTRYVYDAGRVVQTIYPGTGSPTESYTYDAAGRLRTKTDRKGVVTTFEYDPLSRLVRKSYSDASPAVSYAYDEAGAIGRLTSMSNGDDTLRWTYDLTGQAKSEQSTRNASLVSYDYDAAGNRVSLSLDGQLYVTYSYDDAARLLAIARGPSVFGFEYDDANRRTRLTYPNGVATSYSYDTLNRLTGLQAVHNGATTVTSFGYTYDDAGNRLTKATPEFTEAYTYDPQYRLTGAERSGGQIGIWEYGYDKVGNRVAAQAAAAVLSSTYDDRNQLLSSSGGGPMLWRGSLNEAGNVTFTSALVNGKPARMLAGNVFEAMLDTQPGTNTVTLQATDISGNVTTQNYAVDVAATGVSYTYDSNGNLTTKSEGTDNWVYTWNAENQLVKVEKNSVEVARFAYDPLGRRVEKVAGGAATSYTHDEDDIVREVRGATVLKYVHSLGVDEPLARENDAGALTHYHADGLGSVLKRTNQVGAVVHEYRYDAWGNIEAGASEPGYAFTGREWDPDIGLYYYRARYYDAKGGRFIAEDPIGFKGGMNFYSYVAGNPVGLRDPFGLQACPPGRPYVPAKQGWLSKLIFGPVRQVNPCKEAGGLEGYQPTRVDDSGPSPELNPAGWKAWHDTFVDWCDAQPCCAPVCYPLRNPSSGRPGYVCWCCCKGGCKK